MQRRTIVSLLVSLVSSTIIVGTASASFTTEFEAPAYASGPISGQDNWTQSNANVQFTRVLTASEIEAELAAAELNPAMPVRSGDQALFVSSFGTGNTAAIRQVPGFEQAQRVVVDMWARPLFPGAEGSTVGVNLSNVWFILEDETGVAGRAGGVRFGDVQTGVPSIDYWSSGAWVASGVLWDPDTWFQLTTDLDYTTRTYDFFINGDQINNEPIPFGNPDAENFTQLRIFVGTNQAGMIVDDLTVIPEPSALAALAGLAGLLMRRRRS